jgi:hypothetical protein
MTISYQDVWDCFGTTLNREFFHLIVGQTLGAGEFRIVFEHLHRDDLVLKFETHAQSFQNIAEWDFWNDNKKNKRVAQWLAPCEFISPCGIILAMKKTIRPVPADYPKTVPEFLTDLKRTNFGMYEGRLVAHDYGLYNVNAPTKRKKAKWWGVDARSE